MDDCQNKPIQSPSLDKNHTKNWQLQVSNSEKTIVGIHDNTVFKTARL